jgi:hypothetical protein
MGKNKFKKLPPSTDISGIASERKRNYAFNTHFWSKFLGRHAFLLGPEKSG